MFTFVARATSLEPRLCASAWSDLAHPANMPGGPEVLAALSPGFAVVDVTEVVVSATVVQLKTTVAVDVVHVDEATDDAVVTVGIIVSTD